MAFSFMGACQAQSTKSFGGNIIVKLISAYERPSTFAVPQDTDSTFATPIAIKATFVDAIMTPVDTSAGSESYQLNTESPSALRIVDRLQIVYTKKLTAFTDGLAFASASIQLDPTLVLVTKDDEYSISLDSEYFSSSAAFSKESGKDIIVTGTFKWRDIIATDSAGNKTISPPEITVSAESK